MHKFAYLKEKDESKRVFDETKPWFDETRFLKSDWSELFPDAKESIPPNMPIPLGKSVSMTCFVDADHAGCKET